MTDMIKKMKRNEAIREGESVFSVGLISSSGCESHQATTCCWPVRIHAPSAFLLISSPAIRSFCVPARRCVRVFILECVTHTSCALPMRRSSMEQQDLRSFSILSFSFCFSLSRVALLIGLALVLRNAGVCLNGCYSGIHLQMQHSGTPAETGKFT